MKQVKTALITGASSGIGYELAVIHARNGGNLVLVARNENRLSEIKSELEEQFKIQVLIFPIDLSLESAPKEVYDFVKTQNLSIDYLINNAGFGDFMLFADSDWKKTDQMIRLNILSLTELTHLFLKDMIALKSGKIMNLASTAAFLPGPLMAVYFATKAYVLHFSEAIANELKPFGITVTALCPGATESGFQKAANLQESKMVKGKKLPSSKVVAAYGYAAMLKGQTVPIHGFMNKLMVNFIRFFPRNFVVRVVRKFQEK